MGMLLSMGIIMATLPAHQPIARGWERQSTSCSLGQRHHNRQSHIIQGYSHRLQGRSSLRSPASSPRSVPLRRRRAAASLSPSPVDGRPVRPAGQRSAAGAAPARPGRGAADSGPECRP